MRVFSMLVLMLLVASPLLAQETPEQSYQAFVDAVLADDLNDLERTAMFERYFDFESWVSWQEDQTDQNYSPEQRAQLRDEWFEVFRSDEFRDTYRSSNVEVVKELARDIEQGTAELLIQMDAEDGKEKFRVLMKQSEEGTHWRWYAIPSFIEDEPEPATRTPAERLKEIDEQLKLIQERQAELEQLKQQLLEEARRLRNEIVETDAGKSAYASPQSVVETGWQAIEGGDAEGFVECHVYREETGDELESGAIAKKLKKLNARLMSWEVLDTTVDETNPLRASVRVKLKLQQTGEADERTITVKVRKVGDEWKIDEAP